MHYRKELGVFAAVALVIVGIGMAMATIAAVGNGGWHNISFTSSTHYADTGTGFFTLNLGDSTVRNGIYFANGAIVDSRLAILGNGTPKALTGGVSGSAGTFYVQMSDTARATGSVSFSSATAASGSWSSTFSGGSGTAQDTFLNGATFSSDSPTFIFGDSRQAASGTISDTLRFAGSAATANGGSSPFSSTLAVVFGTLADSTNADTMRLIVINPQGKVAGDSQMTRQVNDTTWISSTIRFDTGVTTLVLIFWDASQSRYAIKVGRVAVNVTQTTISGGAGTVTYTGTTGVGNISRIDLTISPSTPTVDTAQIIDIGNDAGPRAGDGFITVDSNTSGFDTRLPNSVFAINLFDAAGNPITSLASGQTFLVVIQYNFGGLTSAAASSIRLLHHNGVTNSWEVVSNSSSDSTNGRLVAYVSSFSNFAMGNVSSGSSAVAPDDDNCVIQNSIGGTSLAGLMPSLRGVRDTMMGSSLGRLFVSGYYGFAAFAMLLVAGAGAGFAFSKRG